MLTLQQWLHEKPFTLALSAGFFGFYAHAGMLTALLESGAQPSKITGSSAGALIGGCWASGTSMLRTREILMSLQRKDFWDPAFGFGLLKGEFFRSLLREILTAKTFETAPVLLSISVFDIFQQQTIALQSGNLSSAIYASCSFPGLFHPIKRNNRWLSDGGIKDRAGLHPIQENDRVFYHHLPSRSPWRQDPWNQLFGSKKAAEIPKRKNMITLTIETLPRVSPNHLSIGKQAFEIALENTRRALHRPMTSSILVY